MGKSVSCKHCWTAVNIPKNLKSESAAVVLRKNCVRMGTIESDLNSNVANSNCVVNRYDVRIIIICEILLREWK